MRTIWETTETHTVGASWQAKKRIAYVESELKKEGVQGHEEVARDQGQENIAAKS